MIDETLLSYEEKAIYTLRALYRRYGYMPYKMRKFEEYELYMRNKDFLLSDRVITFNDTDGQLLALKPDVTLSIIKNGEDISGYKQRVYYDEKVYRVSQSTHKYKEITQAGLECIGDIDLYDIFEAVTLAAQSLSEICGEYYLDISHLGMLSEILSDLCVDEDFSEKALHYLAEKNTHDLKRLCEESSVDSGKFDILCKLIDADGTRGEVLGILKEFSESDAFGELAALSEMLDKTPFSDRIRFDFSVVNDMRYYNGVVFRGFVEGTPCGVLAGGQYDRLMRKMGRSSGAVGFAVYLDLLDRGRQAAEYDVDTLLVCDDETSVLDIADSVRTYTGFGNSVSVQKRRDVPIRFRECKEIGKGEKSC